MIKRLSIASIVAFTTFSSAVCADNLLQVYQTAKLKDPTILASKAQYDLYLEAVNEADAALLPQIGFGLDGGYTNSSNSSASNVNYGADLSLSQSVYNDSTWKQLDIVEKQATQAAAVYGYAAQDLIYRSAVAYFNVLSADESVKSVKANKRAVERQLEQTKQRFDVGLIAITDVHEAQAEFDRTNADLIIAENTLANSYYALRELTGADVVNISYLNTNTFSPEPLVGDVQEWRNKSLEHNLSLHEKRIAKELAKMQIELAETGYGPVVGFTAGVAYDDVNYTSSSSTDYDRTNGSIGLSVDVPIYTGGATSSQVKQAQYNYVIAGEDLVLAFRSTESEVSSGYNNVRASLSSIAAYEQTVTSSKSALEATEAGFEVGTRTIVDVLDATQSLYESENLLANARYDYILNKLQLKYSAGTLSEQDITDISSGLIEVDPKATN